MRLVIDKFRGQVPRQGERKLPTEFAQIARNTRTLSGELEAWQDHAQTAALAKGATVRSVFGMDTDASDGGPFWLHWLDSEAGDLEVRAVYGPIPQASTGNVFQDRVYYTGQNDASGGLHRPKVTTRLLATDPSNQGSAAAGAYPYQWLILGVPEPGSAPVANSTPDLVTTTFSDGSTLAPFNPYSPTGCSIDNTIIVGIAPSIKQTAPAEMHADLTVGQHAGDALTFDFQLSNSLPMSVGGAVSETFRFACDAGGNGLAITIRSSRVAVIDGSNEYFGGKVTWGTATDWSGTGAATSATSGELDGLDRDTHLQASLQVQQDASTLAFKATLIISVAGGATVYTGTQTFEPKGSFAGWRNANSSSTLTWIDSIAYATSTPSESDEQNIVYVMTFVNLFGEEGPPSLVSNEVLFLKGQITTKLTSLPEPSAGDVADYGLRNPASSSEFGTKRLYRSNTGASSTEFQKVADIPYGQTTYTDVVSSDALGAVLESDAYDLPPTDGHSVLAMPNGITVLASKNEVCPSVAYRPHAYPQDYRLQTDLPVVGLGAIDTNIIVATQTFPYIVTGSDPSSMSMSKLEVKQGCASRRSIASLAGVGVLYASQDGLVGVSGNGGVRLLTEAWITRKEWQALNPATMIGEVHDDRYFASYLVGGVRSCFMFDPKADGCGFEYIDLAVLAMFSDSLADALQMVIGTNLRQWDAANTKRPYLWRSKVFELSRPAAFGVAKIRASDYTSLTAKFYSDGVLTFTATVTNENAFVIPKVATRLFEIQLEGTSTVSDVQVAERVEELS